MLLPCAARSVQRCRARVKRRRSVLARKEMFLARLLNGDMRYCYGADIDYVSFTPLMPLIARHAPC